MPCQVDEVCSVSIFKSSGLLSRPSVLAVALIAAGIGGFGTAVQAAYNSGFPEGRSIGPERFPAYAKWDRAMAKDWARDVAADSVCAERLGETCHLAAWSDFIESLRGRDPAEQVRLVNDHLNQIRFIEDRDNWGAKDYWAAPGEFFGRGGDCEDYALTKYLSLRKLGFSAEQLRLVVLKDKRRRVAHAILVVELEGESLVLDNLSDRVLSWSDVGHYKPLYSLNEDSAWLHVPVRDRL